MVVNARPFVGQLVKPEWVDQVASPAYDSMTIEQRQAHRVAHPLSYLHVTRSAPDEPDGDTIDHATLVARGRASLLRLLEAEVFQPEPVTGFLVYELDQDGHRQRGIVCEVPASSFTTGAKPHEATRPDRSALLAEHFLTVRAASSPVACTIADGQRLATLIDEQTTTDPVLEHRSGDGLSQRIWVVSNDQAEARISAALAGDLYIVDGHHRAAANADLLARGHDVPLLVAVFPPDELRLEGFHRLVAPPEGMTAASAFALIARRFVVEQLAGPARPEPGGIVTVVDGAWYRVHFDERPVAGGAVVRLGSLDPVVCEREIINAMLAPAAGDADVEYSPDQGDPAEVVQRASAVGRLPLLVPPVTVADMVEVADGGLIMPAKSTYFVPKVRSGLFLRRYERDFAAG